tara:strand:+ start:1660 stop:2076 length:417 start_codon:yes stop_codon:yes gene_type:complete
MKRHYRNAIIISIACIYFINELNCRNLCFWINNSQDSLFINLYHFINPYILPLLALTSLVKEFRKLAVFISVLGVLQQSYQLFDFLKHEFWQFKNFENYLSSVDLYEFETLIYLVFSYLIYILAFKFFLKKETTKTID